MKLGMLGSGCIFALAALVIYEGISALSGSTKFELVPTHSKKKHVT